MFLRPTRTLLSAFDELTVVGSRWVRIAAKPRVLAGSPQAESKMAIPFITIVPTLHVASMSFYDRVLEYVQHATKRNPEVVVLLEGICDSVEAQQQQMREYKDIVQSEELRATMLARAEDNTLYSTDTLREICAELAVNYDTLDAHRDKVRLQECYLKPKMAALCGAHLRNDADLDMREVQKLLQEESERLAADGKSLPSSFGVSEIGTFPVIREARERKVASVACGLCKRWAEREVEGEVILPWGYFHAEAIAHFILEANQSPAAGRADGTKNAAGEADASVVFVEADEVVDKVPFGVPKEVLRQQG